MKEFRSRVQALAMLSILVLIAADPATQPATLRCSSFDDRWSVSLPLGPCKLYPGSPKAEAIVTAEANEIASNIDASISILKFPAQSNDDAAKQFQKMILESRAVTLRLANWRDADRAVVSYFAPESGRTHIHTWIVHSDRVVELHLSKVRATDDDFARMKKLVSS